MRDGGITHSSLSPFRMIVSGFATLPLIVVTPDSRAYLCNRAPSAFPSLSYVGPKVMQANYEGTMQGFNSAYALQGESQRASVVTQRILGGDSREIVNHAHKIPSTDLETRWIQPLRPPCLTSGPSPLSCTGTNMEQFSSVQETFCSGS